MSHNHQEGKRDTITYMIKVCGVLDEVWLDWFDNLVMTHQGSMTILSGVLDDQASLRGILTRIWDLNLDVLMIVVIGQTECQ